MYKSPKQYPKELRKSPTYRSWESMKSRCNGTAGKKNNKWYSDKEITYCKEWQFFADFLKDMGIRPENTSLDRIDNSKGYFKENCRWATAKEQVANRNGWSKSGYKHIYYIRGKYRFNIRNKVLQYYDTLKEAIIARDNYLKEL